MPTNVSPMLTFSTSASHLMWALSVMVLTGCSATGLGSNEYGCRGMPEGVRCLSARDVYEMTNNPTYSQKIKSIAPRIDAKVNTQPANNQTGNLPHPSSQKAKQSMPIRTPSNVMRIWIAPWEDLHGDLNLASYVFTEIEQRRWHIGIPVSQNSSPSLRPLPLPEKGKRIGEDRQQKNLSIYGETTND